MLLGCLSLVFMFAVPLESYSSGVNGLCYASDLMPGEKIPPSINKSFHLLKGELEAYSQAKTQLSTQVVDCSTIKLYL